MSVESVEGITATQHSTPLINMSTRSGTESQDALQVKNMHNKYTHGHNRTPPFLVQSSELIKIKEIACQQTLFHPLTWI